MIQIQGAYKKHIDQNHMKNPQIGYRAPKILDYNFYSPISKTTKFLKADKPPQFAKEIDNLTIQNLCKYLTPEEIELVKTFTYEIETYFARYVKIRYISLEKMRIGKIVN